jgi:hypothetical protein
MRIVLILTLVLLTVVGAFASNNGVCLSQHNSHEVSIVAADSHTSTDTDSGPYESDCHHEGSLCHNCHLGHCSLLISNPFSLSLSIKLDCPPLIVGRLPAVYLNGPFRPPIA